MRCIPTSELHLYLTGALAVWAPNQSFVFAFATASAVTMLALDHTLAVLVLAGIAGGTIGLCHVLPLSLDFYAHAVSWSSPPSLYITHAPLQELRLSRHSS